MLAELCKETGAVLQEELVKIPISSKKEVNLTLSLVHLDLFHWNSFKLVGHFKLTILENQMEY